MATLPRAAVHLQPAAFIPTFLLGCVLFNYPLIALFNKPGEIADIPLLYFFLFGAWALLIVLMAWVIERRRE